MNDGQKKFKKLLGLSFLGVATLMTLLAIFTTVSVFAQTSDAGAVVNEYQASVMKWGVFAAALAFGMGAVGAGIAISGVGSAAMGAMSEKPEIGSQALIFVAMAEGIAVFGFIAALMILGKF